MILQALHKLAEREGLMDDPDFEPKPVAWIVRVSEEGKLLGIRGTHYTLPAEGKKKSKQMVKPFRIPRRPTGKSGTKAPSAFLVENAKYVFGLPTKDKTFPGKEGKEKSGWFRDMVVRCAEETNDEAARAVVKLLSDVAQGQITVNLPENCRSNELFAFEFGPDIDLLVHERPKVREYWKRLRQDSGEGTTAEKRCLVTGDRIHEVGLFEFVGRAALVSFNKPAFESYGWNGNDNAPISHRAAESCATALSRLLNPAYLMESGQVLPQRSLRLGADTVVCYWPAKESGEEFASAFGGLLEANPEVVREMYQSIWRGKLPEIEDKSAFYALTVTCPEKGRVIVRDWFESTVAVVAFHLAAHFEDLDNVHHPRLKRETLPSQFPASLLIRSLAPGGDDDNVPLSLVGELLEAALRGTPYPFSFLQRALERQRAEIGRENDEGIDGYRAIERSDARAALIKAVLNRRKRFFPETTHYKEVHSDMDPTNLSEGYTLGRLLAVLERIQQEAIGNVNASVVDRYFSGASATPKTVFVRLLKNARHHVTKAKDDETKAGFIFRLDRLIDELATRFDPNTQWLPRPSGPRTAGPLRPRLSPNEEVALDVPRGTDGMGKQPTRRRRANTSGQRARSSGEFTLPHGGVTCPGFFGKLPRHQTGQLPE